MTVAAAPEAVDASGRDDRDRRLVWALRIAKLAILAQFLWMAAFSTIEYQRGALTFDYSIFDQARWLLVHGHWDPYDTVNGFSYWRSHGEFIMWPVAQITRLPPGGLWLLWIQAAATAGCGWVAVSWIARFVSRPRPGSLRRGLPPWSFVAVVAVLSLANPWVYVAAAWDFHFEALGALFALLAARDLYDARRRFWLWAVLLLSCGDVCAVYLVGVALSGLVSRSGSRRKTSIAALVAGTGFVAILSAIHANQGSALQAGYGYLAGPAALHPVPTLGGIATGALTHPGRAVSSIWHNRMDIWANLAPAGTVGIVAPWTFGVALLVLLSSALFHGGLFIAPGFQDFAAYAFVAVGTGMLLARARPTLARPAAAALCALAVCWAFVWLPRYPSEWLTVTPTGGRALAAARSVIPASAEVVASNGVVGRFAGRQQIYGLLGTPKRFRVGSSPVYFVLAPAQGIEAPVQYTESAMAEVAGTLGAELVEHRAGIWVFRWNPPPGTRSVGIQGPQSVVPAWTLPSAAGDVVTEGQASLWRIAGDGSRGYVVHGDYWFEHPGSYVASAEISSTGPVSVEVWNSNTDKLLARRQLAATKGPTSISIPFTQSVPGDEHVFTGHGPLSIHPVSPPAGQPVEIRVFDPGGSLVNVYSVGIAASRSAPSPSG